MDNVSARGKAPCHRFPSQARPQASPAVCKIESAGFGHFIHDSRCAAGCQNGIFCGRKLEEEEEEAAAAACFA